MHRVANRFKPTAVLTALAGGAIFALLSAATIVVVAPREAGATAAYGQQTGMACGQCHRNPAGGGKLTAFGMSWQAGGHKLPGR